MLPNMILNLRPTSNKSNTICWPNNEFKDPSPLNIRMDTMDFDRIDTTDIDDERRFVAFVKKHAKLYQVGTDTGVRRLQTKLKKFNIKDKSLPKSKRKDKMVLDGSRTTEVEKQSKTKMDTEVDKPHPMPERKGKMVLDESSTTEVEKQSKTKMDTEVDEPLPMPERKEYKIYLDRKHEDGLPSAGKRYLESEEAWLAYHTKFLEKVFGSCASEMIEPSFGVTGIFFALLTEEELKQLGGMDGVKIFEEKNYRCEYF
ncbi:hypothetical protein RHGRI_022192 [Rhododendron griersonianum]|uniref:Uncharacterized protein n=1 Tax=Rhododendron griersonianum TaxID=479676 RepID=A0AAV6JS04_9ERIC|nr:hypothetical protein RHGRI_022192 [Rhododendron griersonianum]KAG5542579.1 hypothetical protein RHGRI_022192 [Rhododendron griersonianum]